METHITCSDPVIRGDVDLLVTIRFGLDLTQPLIEFFLLVSVRPLAINSVLISSAVPAPE